MDCRILAYEVADGPVNMGLDEALLDSVAHDASAAAVLRFYGWTDPTLSLGYFQAWAELERDSRWRGVSVVRRPTGGGAIMHDREITYAIVVPGRSAFARGAGALYRGVHDAIAAAIADRGASAHRRGEAEKRIGTVRPFLCFTDRDPHDIVVADAKVVGSAQRRRFGAILQHGSILLETSPLTPELPGLCEAARISTDVASWTTDLRQRIATALGMAEKDDQVSAAERERALDLARNVYSRDYWNLRR
jgi:lipoate-protein ligase A